MITPRTTGIIGVHLWGRAAPIDALQELADEHGLELMFDAAHAFGCSFKGKTIGRFGRAEVLSFHATKFFNTFEGGAVVTDDDELAETMRLMRNFGFAGYDNVIHPGTNGKMIEVCAAMGLVNLAALDAVVDVNRHNYNRYREAVRDIDGLDMLTYDENERSNYQYIVLEVSERCSATRDEIVAALHAENILARKYFWPGCHRMRPYRDLFPHAGLMLTNTIALGRRIVVLPTGTNVGPEEIDQVTSVLQIVTSG